MNSIEKKWMGIKKALIKNKCPDSLTSYIKTLYYEGVIDGINESVKIHKNSKTENVFNLQMTKLIVDSLSNAKKTKCEYIKKPTIENNGTVH